MNKRIRKKKAKQARQQELEQLMLNPEQINKTLQQIGIGISKAFSDIFQALSVAFANASEDWKKWREQFDKEDSK